MLQQLNTRESNNGSTSRTIHIFPNLNLERLYKFLRYGLIAALTVAYVIVSVVCFIQNHPMSTYLIMPIAIVLLIATIHFLSKLNNTKDNTL